METAAGRERRKWLGETLEDSGLPRPIAWVIEKRFKGWEFRAEDLETAIQDAWESMAEIARAEMDAEKSKVSAA